MGGLLGVEQISKVLDVVVEGLNVASKIAHKGGVLSVIAMVDELSALGTLDFEVLKKEVAELDGEDAKRLNDLVAAKLDLVDKVVEAKIKALPSLALECLAVAQEVLAVVAKVKTFIGV